MTLADKLSFRFPLNPHPPKKRPGKLQGYVVEVSAGSEHSFLRTHEGFSPDDLHQYATGPDPAGTSPHLCPRLRFLLRLPARSGCVPVPSPTRRTPTPAPRPTT